MHFYRIGLWAKMQNGSLFTNILFADMFRLGDAIIYRSLNYVVEIQLFAFRLIGTKPSPKPVLIYCQLNHREHT